MTTKSSARWLLPAFFALSSTALVSGALVCTGCKSEGPRTPTKAQRIQLHTETALSYYQMNDLDRAQDQVQRGLEIDEDDKMLRLILGWTLQRRGTREDVLAAESVFRGLTKGGDYRASLGLAEALERKGILYDEAAREVSSGARFTDAADPAARSVELKNLAIEAWEESLVSYEETLAERPNDRATLNGLTRVYSLLGRDEESVGWSEQLITAVDADIVFWRRQLEREDITARQEANLRKLLEDNAALEIRAHLHSATLLRRLGRLAEASAHLDKVVAIHPELAEAHSRRAQNLLELGRPAEAIVAFDRFLALTEEPFESPTVRRVYDLRTQAERELQSIGQK